MQDGFFKKIARHLSVERLDSYGNKDQADPCTVLARYLWNMAVCESLYAPLQLCEVGVRNSIHRYLASLHGVVWYEHPEFRLTPWGQSEVFKVKQKLAKQHCVIQPGHVVSELQFGFWTHLFEDHYESQTDFLPGGIKPVFPNLPKSKHKRKELKKNLDDIRTLRNRVFHHERIIHWNDLTAKHQLILDTIQWTGIELNELAVALDRFTLIHSQGIDPWKDKIRSHWPTGGKEC